MFKECTVVLIYAFILTDMFQDGVAIGKHGMTWSLYSHNEITGVDLVGCNAASGATQVDRRGPDGNTCNAFQGDTSCYKSLPILCKETQADANYPNATAIPKDWSRSQIATTMPVLGIALRSWLTMTSFCMASLGVEWRAAEFHDAGEWTLRGFGRVRGDTRFWVYINDQPANCWNG